MSGRLEWPDPTPDGPTPEQERQMDAERECQHCDGSGRITVFHCKGICECGHCPDVEDCPECCGHTEEIVPEYTDEQLATMRREVAEDELLAVGTHYLDAAGNCLPKNTI